MLQAFSGENNGYIWGNRSKFGHFRPQISPYLASTVTKNCQNYNYLGVLWPEQTFLALNINIKGYRHFLAKILGIFGESGPKFVILGPKFHLIRLIKAPKMVKTILSTAVLYKYTDIQAKVMRFERINANMNIYEAKKSQKLPKLALIFQKFTIFSSKNPNLPNISTKWYFL